MIGSLEEEPGRYGDEGPQTEITIAEGFWLMDAPVTQALWQVVMGENPSRFVSPDRPVELVSWRETRAFYTALNQRLEGLTLGLPSEAQWEYACRAGTAEATYSGSMEILGENNAPVLEEIAWYGGNSGVGFELDEGEDSSGWEDKAHDHRIAGTRPVRLKRPNAFGCYDMLGNVWEWCADAWADSHEGIDKSGAARPVSQQDSDAPRVIRGGSWLDDARFVRAAYRVRNAPGSRFVNLGFRCASVHASLVSSSGQDARSRSRAAAEPALDPPAAAGGENFAGNSAMPEGERAQDASLLPKIFISHSASTADLANQIGTALRDHGLDVMLAADLLSGSHLSERISEGIQAADCVLCLPDDKMSVFMELEIELATKTGNLIMAIPEWMDRSDDPNTSVVVYDPGSSEAAQSVILSAVQARLADNRSGA